MSNAHDCARQITVNLWQEAGSMGTVFRKIFSSNEAKPSTTNRTTICPFTNYVCRKCHNKFGEVLTIKEHETKKVHCPKCQGTELEKVIEPFFAKTARKTRGY
jgi:putative FmdB family regulatory protein